MANVLGQYCINVTDLERTVAFYESLGLTNSSRTSIEQADEAVLNAPGKGQKIQLAQQRANDGPIVHGNAFRKVHIHTTDLAGLWAKAVAAGHELVTEPHEIEGMPVSVGFLRDPDGYLVELIERHPWPEAPETFSWFGQYVLGVSDLEASVAFWETVGLSVLGTREANGERQATLGTPGFDAKVQLVQTNDDAGPIDMGTAMWKLYLLVDDAMGTYDAALAAGYRSLMVPVPLDRWPVIVGFVEAPDGYQVEILQHIG